MKQKNTLSSSLAEDIYQKIKDKIGNHQPQYVTRSIEAALMTFSPRETVDTYDITTANGVLQIRTYIISQEVLGQCGNRNECVTPLEAAILLGDDGTVVNGIVYIESRWFCKSCSAQLVYLLPVDDSSTSVVTPDRCHFCGEHGMWMDLREEHRPDRVTALKLADSAKF